MSGPWEDYAKSDSATEGDSGPWDDFQPKEETKGRQVYAKPVGPEQAGAFDRFKERIQDPQRWKAALRNQGPYAQEIVQGDAPLVMPGGAVPRLAQVATKLAEGKGLGFTAGRTALAYGQGGAMSLAGGEEGESWQDKIDRMKSGGKLSAGIQAAAESIPYAGKLAGTAARKISSAGSGIDESLIRNYATRTDEVNDLVKRSGGDMTEAADQVRTELSSGIQQAKRALNAQISRALRTSAPEATIDVMPIVDRLEAAKARLNPNFKASAIADIDDMIAAIRTEAKGGKVNAASLYQIKQFLNEGSASAYNKGGQIFTRAGEAARAAKEAAATTREMLRPVAGSISQADSQLSKLHAIEKRLNRNLLAPGKPDASLFAAGTGANPRNAATLRELEKISGVPVMQRTLDLATAKTFANPSLAPVDFTGKAAARVLMAGGIGGAVAGPAGMLAAGSVTSPMAVKLGINAVGVAKEISDKFPSFSKFARENPIAAQTIVQLVSRRIRDANRERPFELSPEAEEYFRENPRLMENIQDPKTRAEIEKRVLRRPAQSAPASGPERWARSGLEKLGIQDAQLAEQLLSSKEGKRLLIEASDLPPGSRGMKRIMDQIQKGWGQNHVNEPGSSSASKVPGRERKPASGR